MTAPSEAQIAAEVTERVAEHVYLTLMQETRDHWPLWTFLPPEVKAGYLTRASEVVAPVLAALFAERDAEQRREAVAEAGRAYFEQCPDREPHWVRGWFAAYARKRYPEPGDTAYAAETYPKETER